MSERKKELPTKPPELEAPSKPVDPGADSGSEYFKADAASIVLSIFKPAPGAATAEESPSADPEEAQTKASVKFMITAQEEQNLRGLGYTQEQINKLKPEEAAEILKSGTRPETEKQP